MNELGEWLRYARETRGLTLEDAERDTRISRRYLYALETGELDLIPAPVYARGFLRSYAQYLGLDPQEAMARYPRDDGGPYVVPSAPQRIQQQRAPLEEEDAGTRSAPFGQPRQPQPQASGNRPNWRRPGPGNGPVTGQDAYANAANGAGQDEPMIGVDIGVAVPARRLQNDPAAQTRSMAVLIVAAIAVVGVLAVALVISRLGGGADNESAVPTIDGTVTPDPATATTTAVAGTGSGIMPDVEGETQADAFAAITAAGLVPNVRPEPSDAAAGTVIEQSPDGGTQMEPGDPVTIIVSGGP